MTISYNLCFNGDYVYVIVWFVCLYGKIIHELACSWIKLARGLSFVQMHNPYCTSMHFHFVYRLIFDENYLHIKKRCNKALIVWCMYGKIIHELARALSFVQMHKPYNIYFYCTSMHFHLCL